MCSLLCLSASIPYVHMPGMLTPGALSAALDSTGRVFCVTVCFPEYEMPLQVKEVLGLLGGEEKAE